MTFSLNFSGFSLFGIEIALYGLLFFGGIGLAVLAGAFLCKRKGFPIWEMLHAAVFVMAGALIGAKLLFVIVSWSDIVDTFARYVPKYASAWDVILIYIKGGFVFYGGLLGGLFGMWIYTRVLYKERIAPYLDLYAAALPLGHALGRVGCFFAGCCYGMPCDAFGVIYNRDAVAGPTPTGVPLLPVQLIEAACLLLLFACMVCVYLRSKKEGTTALLYVLSYACLRFVLEFFRGDEGRGSFFFLSTSQWICVALAAAALAVIALRHRRRADTA